MTEPEREAFNASGSKKLHQGGWICASWPTGVRGQGPVAHRAGRPERGVRPGRGARCGPTSSATPWSARPSCSGAPRSRSSEFIPKILDGTISWCQGFSEPDAGSDLASLKTRAELDGDEWVINGQKVWTTQAQFADYIFLLARTDPDAPAPRGISYLLVPMKQPGRRGPAHQADRRLGRVQRGVLHRGPLSPAANVVGGDNNGWKVAMTTLGFERGSSATTGHRRFPGSSTTSSTTPGARVATPTPRSARAWPGPGPR